MPKIELKQYKTLIFDCDGVILNSNKIKTQAFYDVAKIYGHEPAQALKDYHILNGGISRYEKFEYLLTDILNRSVVAKELEHLLLNFSKEVKKSLLTCEIATNIKELREKTKHAKWLIVSGGDQSELREIFYQRGIDDYFNVGIFGSPDDKVHIIRIAAINKQENYPILFLGDSYYDYLVSKKYQMDFVFISHWTAAPNWKDFVKEKKINSVGRLEDLIYD